MEQIPDAPYIVEAETKGMPHPAKLPEADMISVEFTQARYHIGQAVDYLCRSSNRVEGTEWESVIESLIERLDDLSCDISITREKMIGK